MLFKEIRLKDLLHILDFDTAYTEVTCLNIRDDKTMECLDVANFYENEAKDVANIISDDLVVTDIRIDGDQWYGQYDNIKVDIYVKHKNKEEEKNRPT